MATPKLPFASLQAPCAYKRNKYRNLVIEFYARNSSTVLAITRRRWPATTYASYAELAQLLSAEIGWQVDSRSLARQFRRVNRFDPSVKDRVFEIISQNDFVADGVVQPLKN